MAGAFRMSRLIAPILLILIIAGTVSAQSLRGKVSRGNDEYREEKYQEALNSYQDALLSDPQHEIARFNTGDALYKLEKYDQAREAYEKLIGSPDIRLESQAFYNIGNTYFQQDSLLKAIEAYKNALDRNPADTDTKYNLELARAKLKEQAEKQQQQPQDQQQQQDQKQIQPSEYAKELKKRAEDMVARRQYFAAAALMKEGLQKDETVAAFQDFMQRIDQVIGFTEL